MSGGLTSTMPVEDKTQLGPEGKERGLPQPPSRPEHSRLREWQMALAKTQLWPVLTEPSEGEERKMSLGRTTEATSWET